jgi:polyphosphate kinase
MHSSARNETIDYLVDRDISTLAFNRRVLVLAQNAEVPLLERLRYLCIVSSNLDEFFEVRMALHLRAAQAGATGPFSKKTYEAASSEAQALIGEQYDCFNRLLLPALQQKGIRILSHHERNTAQKKWVAQYFAREVQPLLLPIRLDPAHPFPQVANKSLNFIVDLSKAQSSQAEPSIGILRVPRTLPRFIRLPAKLSSSKITVISLSSVIRSHLKELFGSTATASFSQFRVTRDSDLFVDEEDMQDLKSAMRQRLEVRPYGQPVRLEVSSRCSEKLALYLSENFQLPAQAVYQVNGPVNLVRLNQIIELAKSPELLFEPFLPAKKNKIPADSTAFELLKEKDILVHHPYESFDAVVHFLQAAVNDPDVVAIKQTIYRAGNISVLMDLLQQGVARGKDVTAVLEIKARFDEENNIRWAERLEAAGVQLVYGVVGLKTHAKMLLITRKEGRHLKRYAHLSTGNYNPQTAKLYTDFGYFTADTKVTHDIEKLFRYLANPKALPNLQTLILAPLHLHKCLLNHIVAATAQARAGKPASITAKMNSLTDFALADALIVAATAGVKIDLIVRGSCVLRAPVQLKSKISIRSIVGRFLEHSRVFHFAYGNQDALYLSSADWMNRNMTRRVEIAWLVTDPQLKRRIINEALSSYLADTVNAWQLVPDNGYQRVSKLFPRRKPVSAQALLMSQ